MANEKRLIEANALVEWLKRAGWFLKGTENHKPTTKAIGKIIDHVEAMPDVDAVKHGRWIEGEMVIDDGVGGHIYHCSECEDWYHAWTPNYCPNCGAKMDGDGNA